MADNVIAIDGPAGSGKSTTAAEVARRLGLAHLDSGALYRSLTLAALESETPFTGEELAALAYHSPVELRLADGGYVPTVSSREVSDEIRSETVTARVSEVAALGPVRDWVNWALAQAAALHPRGVVVDGRDIGSVVFPGAALKVFLVASPSARARRRAIDLGLASDEAEVERIRSEIIVRDEADSGREIAPLSRAADAVELDTTDMSFEEQVDQVVELARERFPSP